MMEKSMVTLELAKRRKTVRRFKKAKPPREYIEMAVSVAKEAPSGMNAQPWFFLVVEDDSLKSRIRNICERAERAFYEKVSGKLGDWLKEKGFTYEKPFLSEAPYLIFVLGNAKEPFWIQSVWISIGYLLLALEELGLGSVTYTPPNPREVEEIVNVGEYWRLQTIVAVGYPADSKPKYPRKELGEVLKFI